MHPLGAAAPAPPTVEVAAPTAAREDRPAAPATSTPATPASTPPRAASAEVRVDLRLWDADAGKSIRLRAPQTITPASFERFLQTFKLLVRIEEPVKPVDKS